MYHSVQVSPLRPRLAQDIDNYFQVRSIHTGDTLGPDYGRFSHLAGTLPLFGGCSGQCVNG